MNTLILCVVTAFFFALWPSLARFASASPGWLAVLMSLGTATTASFGMITSKYLAGDGLPKSKAALIIFVAGLVNGIGMLAYTKMISSPSVELSKFVPIAAALVPVFAMLIAVVLFGDPITLKKIAGLTLACVAVFLLS